MRYSIGIDLGGTNIKAVAVAESGEALEYAAAQTQDHSSVVWSSKVRELIERLELHLSEPATCIGIASPGMVARGGRTMASVSGPLKSLEGFHWGDFLLGRQPVLINDAHAALLGEVWKGAAAGFRDAVMLTLGTGVGGAILADGRLLRGHLGRGGHIGHICLNLDGQPNSIGIPGTLEDAIGNRTVEMRSGGRFTSTEQLVSAHLSSDVDASRIWLRSIYYLACAVTSMINVLDPEVFVIGGGIAHARQALFGPLEDYLETMEWRPQGHNVRILPAILGDQAGAVGAARNAMQLQPEAAS
jgi:glucokinase